MVVTIVILVLLGLCAGSFINAAVWRLRQQELAQSKTKNQKPKTTVALDSRFSILKGRSRCPECGHKLAAKDLVPVISWLTLKGKCRYCQAPIDDSPLIELLSAAVFVGLYLFWPASLNTSAEIVLFTTWILAFVGLIALAIYDLKWFLLPNKFIYSTLAVAASGRLIYLLLHEDKIRQGGAWALGVIVASGLFYILFMVSKGKWIGFGDVRLGLITGTLLADPQKAAMMIFGASVIGSLVVLPAVAAGRAKLDTKIPFGPLLIASTLAVGLFGHNATDFLNELVLASIIGSR